MAAIILQQLENFLAPQGSILEYSDAVQKYGYSTVQYIITYESNIGGEAGGRG
jgi:hypothetical protein